METDESRVKLNSFPSKLWRLVNDPRISSICWDASEEAILVHQELFEAEVLFSSNGEMREYFKTTDFTSFVRQLHLYGFKRVCQVFNIPTQQLRSNFFTAHLYHFYNPNFKRANPELLVDLKPLTIINRVKLAAGIALSSLSSRHFHNKLLNSPQKHLTVLKKDIVEQQEPHHHHPCNESLRGKDCDRTPSPSHAFVMGRGNPGSVFHHYPVYSPCAHPTSSMHMSQCSQSAEYAENAFVPHYLEYRFYAPVYQCCSLCSLDSTMACSQQPAASCMHRGYYPDYSVSFHQCTGQNPNRQAGDARDPRESDMSLDAIFNAADEMQMQAALPASLLPMKSHLEKTISVGTFS